MNFIYVWMAIWIAFLYLPLAFDDYNFPNSKSKNEISEDEKNTKKSWSS